MLRRNPLGQERAAALRETRLRLTAGPALAPPMTGTAGAIQAGAADADGVFRRVGLTEIDDPETFYVLQG